jgi:hypothetical protein
MLGLPGVGKSHMADGFRYSKSIASFRLYQRLAFLFRGLFADPIFFFKLLVIRVANGSPVRPALVLAERVGIYQSFKDDRVLLDEGILQFVWRSCCELDKSPYLYCLVKKFLQNYAINTVYIKCSKNDNIKNILFRKKRQRYDDSVSSGSFDTFIEGRSTMVFLLRVMKDVSHPVHLSVPSYYV